MAPTTKPKPIPDAYRRVTPRLVVQGGVKALEFYAAVFGATERMRFPGPGGTVAHAEVQIGDSVVIVEDEVPERGTKAPPPRWRCRFPVVAVHLCRGRGRGRRASGGAGRNAAACPPGPVLRRPGRVRRGSVRAWMDRRDACGGRGAGGAGAADGRAGDPDLAPMPLG
jgi:hypothetical protein